MEHTLSSGVKVEFTRIPESIATDVMVHSFSDLKFDKNGQLKDTQKLDEQLAAAAKIQSYHNKLIAYGVTLVGSIEDYTNVPEIGTKWLSKLKRADVDLSKYDLTDDDDLEFIFLRHYAFKSAADFEALSRFTLGQQ